MNEIFYVILVTVGNDCRNWNANDVIVIAHLIGIYGSKPTESEGAARGQGRFTSP